MALGCGKLDLAAWRARNRVRVHPGEAERWVIALPLAPDLPEAPHWSKAEVQSAITRLFGEWQTLFRSTEPRVISYGETAPAVPMPQFIGGLPDKPSVRAGRPGPLVLVEVQILGDKIHVPWPTFRSTRKPDEETGERFDPLCPVNVDAYLLGASTPVAGDSSPEALPPPDREVLPGSGLPGVPDLSEPVREAGRTLATVAKVALWAGAGLLLWQLWGATQDARSRIRSL